jgi:hypothetical protein
MKRYLSILIPLIALATIVLGSDSTTPSQGSKDERAVWDLEHSYWRYVESNDLAAYSNLWHKNFLGWPSVSATPVRKDHITDWITSETSKGSSFKTHQFKPAAIQVNDDVAMACYWITFSWLDKNGKGPTHTVRITHAWLRTGDSWQIIGGMSMGEPETPKK